MVEWITAFKSKSHIHHSLDPMRRDRLTQDTGVLLISIHLAQLLLTYSTGQTRMFLTFLHPSSYPGRAQEMGSRGDNSNNLVKFSGGRHSERVALRLFKIRDTQVASFCSVIHVDLEREWAVIWTSFVSMPVGNGVGHPIVPTWVPEKYKPIACLSDTLSKKSCSDSVHGVSRNRSVLSLMHSRHKR